MADGVWGNYPVQGHDHLWKLLTSKPAPERMHFLGPEGVGRKKFARDFHFTINGGRSGDDYLYVNNPTKDDILALLTFSTFLPAGKHRTIAIEFSEPIPLGVQASMSQLLDYEGTAKIIVISAGELPESLASRLVTFRFEPLDDEAIRKVLVNMKTPQTHIDRIIELSDGTVASARAYRTVVEDQERVLKLLDSIIERDYRAITALRKDWSRLSTANLRRWLHESLTQQWRYYQAADDRALARPAKMALLKATSKHGQGTYPEIRRVAEDIARGGNGA